MKRKVDLKIKLNFSPVASLAGLQRITTISGSCRMLVEILSLCFGQFCDDFFNSGVNLIFPSINLLVCVCQFILCNLPESESRVTTFLNLNRSYIHEIYPPYWNTFPNFISGTQLSKDSRVTKLEIGFVRTVVH